MSQLVRPMRMRGVWGMGGDAHGQPGEGSAVQLRHAADVHVENQPEPSAWPPDEIVFRRVSPGNCVLTVCKAGKCIETGYGVPVWGEVEACDRPMAGFIEV